MGDKTTVLGVDDEPRLRKEESVLIIGAVSGKTERQEQDRKGAVNGGISC